MGDGSLRGVHERLLIGYVIVLHEAMGQEETSDQASRISAKWLHEVRRIGRSYLTSGRVWQKLFSVLADASWEEGKAEVLGAVHTAWRGEDEDGAGVTWAGWLAEHGRGGEAAGVVGRLGAGGQAGWQCWLSQRI